MLDNDKLLSTEEAAAMLRVSKNTLYRYILASKLKAHKYGGINSGSRGHWKIWQSDLEAFMRGE